MQILFIGRPLFSLVIKSSQKSKITLIAACLFFLHIALNAQDSHIIPIEGDIDAEGFFENAPTISIDGNTMIYVSNKLEGKKLFESKKIDNKWTEGKPIEAINNFGFSKSFISEPSLSYDGNTLYFCADYTENMDIYYSERVDGKWAAPVNLGSPINSKGYEGSPFISADNQTLFFVKDKSSASSGDFDCKDLYSSRKNDDGSWGEPKMLPAPVNLQCEKSPRICADNKTLFYCSFRGDKKAFFNIYRTKIIADRVWAEPEYMEFASTEKRDQFPCVTAYGDTLYFNISQPVGRDTYGGIFKAAIPEAYQPEKTLIVKGKVLDVYSKQPITATIDVFDARTRESIYDMKNNATDGTFLFTLPQGRNYSVEFAGNGYSYQYLSFIVDDIAEKKEVYETIYLYKDAKLNLNVFDKDLYDAINAEFKVYDSQGAQVKLKINETSRGRYEMFIPVGDVYTINVSKNCYKDTAIDIDLTKPQFIDFENNIELSPQKTDLLIDLKEELTGKNIKAEIQLSNKHKDETIIITPEMIEKGQYTAYLRNCDEYDILVNSEGYNYFSSSFDMSNQQFYDQTSGEDKMNQEGKNKIEIKLDKFEEGSSLQINNILFEYNSFELLATSFAELDKVVKFMDVNNKIKVEISAHTDDLGAADYNMRLSQKRAQSVVNYLLEKNIEQERIISTGYGKTKPLLPNINDENRAKNRRVELKILKMN